MKNKLYLNLSILLIFCLGLQPALLAQKKKNKKQTETISHTDPIFYDALEWRSIGPWRGGRSGAVTGVPDQRNLFYFGSAGGGVWKTEDGGRNWENISDGFFGGSIGAVAVSEWDPNVIYVGGGEQTVRGNVSSGYGMWKSVDAGRTWEHIGLDESRHIARIRIHPRNPDIVFAAVMGNLYKPHSQRGVFKSIDGGKTWKKVLFVNDEVGSVDLTFDPTNHRILYASTWRIKRTPYSLESGGEGSGLWKSTDSGETWENISRNEGLPKGTLGIIGVAVSPVNSDRVWAIIEAKDGGVFRSDDGGKKWQKTNSDRSLRQRAWYYTRIYADPKDEDRIYVLNVRYHRSDDGGKTFKSFSSQHSDHHDLWIDPHDPGRMVIGDDGGAQITYDGGETWSTYYNQPTAQFYRVTTDDHFPYRIYAAQQDNSTVRILHRTDSWSIGEDHWESTAGCECGHIAIDPANNDIVYGGCYDGLLQRKNHATNQSRNVNVWPDNPMGHGVEGMKYRFQWNFPIFFSPHNPKKLYTASQHMHVSYDDGQSWEIISPDLTRNDSTKMGSSGGPITKDNTSVEYYCTIFAAAESPIKEGVIWAGSDDGLIHVTRDGGQNWQNVTPKGLPEWIMINSIEPHPFEEGGAYVAATMYKSGDFKPYIYRTKDYGASWTKIINGIDEEHFTRVVRADPKQKGLLYAGTETGMYISFDDGNNWQSFQLNLPIVPITDLAIKDNNLVAATQGRSIWLIDDLTVIHQLSEEITRKDFHVFQPKPTYQMGGGYSKNVRNAGVNHPNGVMVFSYLKKLTDTTEVKLSFLTKDGELIREFSTNAKERREKLELEEGSNMFVWNMEYPPAKRFDGMVLWWASTSGPEVPPGEYVLRMMVDSVVQEQPFEVIIDPRSESSLADMQKKFDFLKEVIDKVTEAHEAIIEIRDIRGQLKNYTKRLPDEEEYEDLRDMASAIDSVMTEVEEALYQTKNRSGQDPLNFPIRLTNKLGHLNSLVRGGNFPPTDQAIEVKEVLSKEIDRELTKLKVVKEEELPKFNKMVREKQVDAIILQSED